MSGEKRFRTSLFGFKKSDVNLYIEKILKDFEDRLREKDEEIIGLKVQNKDMNKRYEEIIEKSDRTIEDRTKIADVLIKAQEKAELIIADAVRKANKEKKEIESLIELEREKLVDIKKEIKVLQTDVIDRLKKYEVSLDEIIEEDKAVG